jgi:hypothetical protein
LTYCLFIFYHHYVPPLPPLPFAAASELKANEKVRFLHIMLFTISFSLDNLMVTWSSALEGGFWEYMTANGVIGSAYICLILCQAEMTSILPFSGESMSYVLCIWHTTYDN